MKRFFACFGLAAALLALPVRGEEDFLPAGPLHNAGLAKFWQLRLPLPPGDRIAAMFAVDDQVYVATDGGLVFAIFADTGTLRWVQPVIRSGYAPRRPAHAGDRVLFNTPDEVIELNRLTGKPLARHELEFPIGTGVVSDGARFYVGGIDRRVYAFALEDRPDYESLAVSVSPNWLRDYNSLARRGLSRLMPAGAAYPRGTIVSDGDHYYIKGTDGTFGALSPLPVYEVWKFVTAGSILSTPALYGGDLFVASENGVVYGCTAGGKAFRWQNSTYGSVTGDLAVDERGVYVPCRDQSLYLLDLQFGEVRWRARFSAPLTEPPVLTPDLAFQYTTDDGVVAVETSVISVDERLRWHVPLGRTALAADTTLAWLLMRDETLGSVDLKTGEQRASAPAPGFTIAAPAVALTACIIAAPDGRVFCARPEGVPFVRREEVRAALMPPAPKQADEIPAKEEAGPGPTTPPRSLLETERQGLPVGGKSRVTREFENKQPASKPAEPPKAGETGESGKPSDSGKPADREKPDSAKGEDKSKEKP